jgi:hypothetical protein
MVININLNFINQMNKLGLKLVKALSLVYIHLLVLLLNFMYAIRVNEMFFKVINYLGNYFKGVNGIKLILSIQVTLSVSINNIKDVIYTSIFIYKVININLKFINDLNILIIIS